jgi:hypothetical protein
MYRLNSRAYLYWHAGNMKPVRKQNPLAEHALVSRAKLDLGDRERVTEVKRAIHVGVREVSEPFRKPLTELSRCKVDHLVCVRRVGLEKALGRPARLRLLLKRDEDVAFARLDIRSVPMSVRHETLRAWGHT